MSASSRFPGGTRKVIEPSGDLELAQLSLSNRLDGDEALDTLAARKGLGVGVTERDNHADIVARYLVLTMILQSAKDPNMPRPQYTTTIGRLLVPGTAGEPQTLVCPVCAHCRRQRGTEFLRTNVETGSHVLAFLRIGLNATRGSLRS